MSMKTFTSENPTLLAKFLTLFILCFISQISFAQESVTGKVSDVNGIPLIGVTIIEKNTSNGTTTDFDGNFEINIENQAVLVFSYLGFEGKEIPVTPGQNFNVVL